MIKRLHLKGPSNAGLHAGRIAEQNRVFTVEVAQARNEVQRQPAGPGRNALAAELVLFVLAFSGTDEQVKEQLRYRWQPDIDSTRVVKMSERPYTIHEELRQTLGLLQGQQPPVERLAQPRLRPINP